MSRQINNVNVRASPAGDAQVQHPAPVRSGLGLSHHPGRGRRKKRVQVRRLRIGSWNVGTMTGRGAELANILQKRRINIACLQETKWKGTKARELSDGYKFFYCGKDGKRNGVGIVLDKDLKNNIIEINRVSDRIIYIRILLGDLALTIMSVYAPQAGCDERIKEKFWEEFDTTLMNVPSDDQLVIGGDFNGHVGKYNHDYERVHGGKGFGSRNFEGECILEMATAFDLALVNTYFQKKDEHLITYKSGQHATQIDYMLTRRSDIKKVKDCKVIPGEPLTSQHRLLVVELDIDLNRINYRQKHVPKTKWWLLQNENFAADFKDRIVRKIREVEFNENITVDDDWNVIANTIRE
ncbi:craniofacial development protein 2-like [Plutella xylostella]|uniref:craniofacial development protein 2-like n=1 Tax=Plutella xylostella TaxID=51655 RepID=UPI002032D795|nr:craniofacial development protein 2-like [Plutella xylostella]